MGSGVAQEEHQIDCAFHLNNPNDCLHNVDTLIMMHFTALLSVSQRLKSRGCQHGPVVLNGDDCDMTK